MAPRPRALLWYFRATLVAFALAALTGVLFRGVQAWRWDLGLDLGHVRHAHSHLMFFGWLTPALLALSASRAASLAGRPISRAVGRVLGITLVLGIAIHPLFLRFGYDTVAIGPARLPIAAVVSGLAVLAWYAYVALWARETRRIPRTTALRAWDLALALLVMSTLAVWPLALLRPLGLDAERWMPVLVHAFLDPFSEGFFVLAVLGLAHAERGTGSARRWALWLLFACAPLTFPLAIAGSALPSSLRWIASAASIGWGIGLLAQLELLAHRAPWPWRIPLAAGAVAACAKIAVGLTPWIDWSAMMGMRLLYLHALLFGLVSLGVLGAARGLLGARAVPLLALVQCAALALIASLVPMSELWPRAWSGHWPLDVAALVAILAAFCVTANALASLVHGSGGAHAQHSPSRGDLHRSARFG